jgi:hypothetical protein
MDDDVLREKTEKLAERCVAISPLRLDTWRKQKIAAHFYRQVYMNWRETFGHHYYNCGLKPAVSTFWSRTGGGLSTEYDVTEVIDHIFPLDPNAITFPGIELFYDWLLESVDELVAIFLGRDL